MYEDISRSRVFDTVNFFDHSKINIFLMVFARFTSSAQNLYGVAVFCCKVSTVQLETGKVFPNINVEE